MLLHMVSFAISIFVKCCPAACDGAQCLREALDTVPMTDPYSPALHHCRFRDFPLVTNPPYLRSYVGAPVVLANGHRVGVL